MPYLAQEHLDIPTTDILTFCSEKKIQYDQNEPLYLDCANSTQNISAAQTWTLIRQLIAGFRAAGLQQGDCVCIHAFNFLYYPILVQGIIGAGGVFVGTNPSYTTFELHHALETSKARFVITESELLANIIKPAKGLGIAEPRVFLTSDTVGKSDIRSWRSLLDHGEGDWKHFNDLETAKTTNAMLLFSSGTTGLPKAVQISHYNLIAQHVLVHENPRHPEDYRVSRMMSLPMFHAAAAPYTHISSLRSGYPVYIMRRFEPTAYLASIERFEATNLMMVPPMVTAVIALASSSADKREEVKRQLASVRAVIAGAAPMDRETQGRMQALLPQASPMTQVWAMSETCCLASYFYHPQSDTSGSVGRFIPNIDVKVVDENGNEVDASTRGELCVRGPTVTRGYLDNPEANVRDWDEEGYFHTGDIVVRDKDTGLWYVVDRKKELIKVRGFQVAPAEIEGVLLGHPGVSDAAAIGVLGSDGGEVPRAYVIRKKNSDGTTERELKEWVAARLAKYKQLVGGIRFVDAIPKNASGKILKRILREQAKQETRSKL